MYHRLTSFDALKQSTYICAHRITFSGRRIIILNKLSCFQSKQTFGRSENIVSKSSLAVEENDFFTVAQCSHGVLCIVQERPKIL